MTESCSGPSCQGPGSKRVCRSSPCPHHAGSRGRSEAGGIPDGERTSELEHPRAPARRWENGGDAVRDSAGAEGRGPSALAAGPVTALARKARAGGPAVMRSAGQGEAVGAEDLVDRLEVGGAAGGAVAGATGGHALGLGARNPRAARVTGLRADVGAGQAGDRALRVVDGGVLGLDGAAVHARRGAGAADRRTHPSLRGTGDARADARHLVGRGPVRRGPHPGVVIAREGRTREGARAAAGARGGGPGAAAVARGHEAAGHGEADGAAAGAANVVGSSTDNLSQRTRRLGRLHDADRALLVAGEGGKAVRLPLRHARLGLDHDGVGALIDVPSVDGLVRVPRVAVQGGLELLELRQGPGDHLGLGAGAAHQGRVGLVGDTDDELQAVLAQPRTAEAVAQLTLQRLLDAGRRRLERQPTLHLRLAEPEVLLHLGDHVRVDGDFRRCCKALSRCQSCDQSRNRRQCVELASHGCTTSGDEAGWVVNKPGVFRARSQNGFLALKLQYRQ
ncbi:hypothetical protein STIAU_7907 [Stigmatella aurantiaca DW4/3-1]|uniref:Uncharacterized protein n=1 Tax=Stigmatella aurantiaca (strain DW4/3-1) TaxID=378806 RepID=Q095I6_STIAD|nr:hypothetical protein STIAU_7907 [Stigmatella aurantiaca DW4/3-1]